VSHFIDKKTLLSVEIAANPMFHWKPFAQFNHTKYR